MNDFRKWGVLLTICCAATGFLSAAAMADDAAEGGGKAMNAELLIEEDFSRGLEDWVWTGPPGAIVEVDDGMLHLDPLRAEHRPPGIEGINLWYRQPIEGDWAIEFDLEPIFPTATDSESGNLLFMLNYNYVDPELDVIEEAPSQTGHYALLHGFGRGVQTVEEATGVKYRPMSGHTITYHRINPGSDYPYMIVIRRNPGFQEVHREIQAAEDQWAFPHTVRIERKGPSLRLFQDDKLAMDARDNVGEPKLDRGYFGIRSWKVKAKINAVRVYRLKADSEDETAATGQR